MAITKLLRIKQVNGSKPAAHLKRNIFYIFNPEKTGGGIWIGGNAGNFPETIYNNMVTNKLLWGKQEGSQGFHYVLSFPPDSPVDESLALKIAGEFCEELLGGNFLYCIAVHNDQAHMHAHITFDSVSKTDGYKFHSPKGDWEKRIQPITDRLCEKYHLPTLAYDAGDLKGIDHGSWESAKRSERNREWEKNRTVRADGDRKWENNMRKTPEMNGRNMTMLENDADVEAAAEKNRMTWHDILRADIDDAIASSRTYDDFLNILRDQHYVVCDGKYLSLKAFGQEKAMRTRRLGPAYEKAAIIERIKGGREKGTRHLFYGEPESVHGFLREKAHGGWRLSIFQRAYYLRWHYTARLRCASGKERWEQKQRLLGLSRYARQITFMIKNDLRSLDDLTNMQEETERQLRFTEERIRKGGGLDPEEYLSFRRTLLQRLRMCGDIRKENFSEESLAAIWQSRTAAVLGQKGGTSRDEEAGRTANGNKIISGQ